jgi:hypothetical protein
MQYLGPFVRATPPPPKIREEEVLSCLHYGCPGFKKSLPYYYCPFCGNLLEITYLKVEKPDSFPAIEWTEVCVNIKFKIIPTPYGFSDKYHYWLPLHYKSLTIVSPEIVYNSIRSIESCLSYNDFQRYYKNQVECLFGLLVYKQKENGYATQKKSDKISLHKSAHLDSIAQEISPSSKS